MLWSCLFFCSAALAQTSETPETALYYGSKPPVELLQAFDVVVLDPSRATPPDASHTPLTQWAARIRLTQNLSTAQLQKQIEQYWAKGYRGFLLDDGAGLLNETPQQSAAMEQAIKTVHAAKPQAHLLVRNHLDTAKAHANTLDTIIVDSLYRQRQGYSGLQARVAEGTRHEALEHIRQLRNAGPHVVAVDYCPGTDRQCRQDVAQQLQEHNVQPYVTSTDLGTIGISHLEVMPRKVLLVQALAQDVHLDDSTGIKTLAMPLNYLGYDIDYLDLNRDSLPTHVGTDRYAGIVVVLDDTVKQPGQWQQWLLQRIREGMPVAVTGSFGFTIDASAATALDLDLVTKPRPTSGRAQITKQADLMGFEALPAPDLRAVVGIQAKDASKTLLGLENGDYAYDAAALTNWGGYILAPFATVSQDAVGAYRLGFQPLEFFRKALRLPDMPVPDVTSENGRRLMFTHVDGDGFVSRAEFQPEYGKFSGEVLHDHILTRYPIPMTVSVIEGEVARTGAYPELSDELEPLARRIFALPNVEIASHTFSHPFFLRQIDHQTGERVKPFYQTAEEKADPFSLPVPNYQFDLDREISGSIDYINQQLAPAGKTVGTLLWSGDAMAPELGLRKAAAAGVFNMNGGTTTITHSNDSWTRIAPYGVSKGDGADAYQVYAAVMNENVYTNDWLGPFYGFKRVLETFDMTNEPIRFKALNIYYHFYSATKEASLKALREIFDAALHQPVSPVYATDYIKRVLQWRRASVARRDNGWIVRGGPDLRQWRWHGDGVPALSQATGLAGYRPGPGGLYIHASNNQAAFSFTNQPDNDLAYVHDATGFIKDLQRNGRSVEFELGGYYQPEAEIRAPSTCHPTVSQGDVQAQRTAQGWRIRVPGNPAKPMSWHTVGVLCD